MSVYLTEIKYLKPNQMPFQMTTPDDNLDNSPNENADDKPDEITR
jgi:hypothetical protein